MNRQALTTALLAALLAAGLAVSAGAAGASDPSAPVTQLHQPGAYTDTPLTAEDVHRKAVFDERRNEVGVVRDVVDSARLGPLAIVEVRGDRGTAPKTVAVALDQLILEPDGRLVALVDGEDLKRLPDFPRRSGSVSGRGAGSGARGLAEDAG